MAATSPVPDGRADVALRLPADSAYASVLRTTTAGLAARLDFTVDDIEDLRIAVGEASAMALEVADADSDLTAEFELAPAELTVTVSVASAASAAAPEEPDLESFAWQVLTTLATEASLTHEEGRYAVRMVMHSSVDLGR